MGHSFMVAAYCVVWAIQLGYLISMAARWASQQKKLPPASKNPAN
jgi:hypothetical protein